MAETRYRQYKLVFEQPDGCIELVCWLQAPALTVGCQLLLKGDDRRWRISERYEPVLDAPPEKAWKVGGLL